ncbi:methionyl-tRNA formyltransferase [Brevundimonas sp. UBA2416]|uniref:methionyl-tRNA formyltransferase n=1 Tax=Brevundimonas sp. UBA2416 TaxID=1946124 RepID=UPI0025C6D60E|nr:methionyl-tRNA formyltransferase [Brevundimonas sp. UBA2416]
MTPRPLLFAYSEVGAEALALLLARDVTVAGLVTHAADPDENIWFRPPAALAHERGLPVFTPDDVNDPAWIERLRSLQPDLILSAYYRNLLPPRLLEAARLGAFNLHGSLLPRWRGAAPIQRAIMAGDRQTGVQIMRMSEGLDEGAILLSEILDIRADDTAASLGERMSHIGAGLWPRALAAIERGGVEGTEQVGEPTYAKKITPAEARIDWSRPAAEVDAHIRGLSPFPGAWFEVPGEDGPVRIKVLMSRVAPDGAGAPGQVLDGALRIACGDGAVELLRVQRAGKAAQSAEEMLRGFPLPAGTVLLPSSSEPPRGER